MVQAVRLAAWALALAQAACAHAADQAGAGRSPLLHYHDGCATAATPTCERWQGPPRGTTGNPQLPGGPTIHTLIATDCQRYFTWCAGAG